MLLLLSLLGTAVVAHSVKLPNIKNLSPKTALPLALKDFQRKKQDVSIYREDKIFRGETADSSIAPFQVLLTMNGGYCGGSILDESWVITASHCITNETKIFHPSDFEVWAGELDRGDVDGDVEQYRRVDMVIVHPSYDDVEISSDVGLLHLETPFNLNDVISTITLGEELPVPGDTVRTSGFGLNHNGETPQLLKWIEQPVPSLEDCFQSYDQHGLMLDDTMFCAGDEEMWYRSGAGDSGGPVFQIIDDTPYLVGLVSFSIDEAYDVNTRISNFIDWIEDNMEIEYETLMANDNDKQWSWSGGGEGYEAKYIKLGCDTDNCRVQIKALAIQFSGGEADDDFEMTMFDGSNLSEDEEKKTPFVTIDVKHYATIPAQAGYVSEGENMTIVILVGGKKAAIGVNFNYAILDYSSCEDEANKCNEVNDCTDLSDEIGCEYNDTSKDRSEFAAGCYLDDFKCGVDSYCIRDYKRCDGYNDCPESSDEASVLCGAALSISAQFYVIVSACILSLFFVQ